MLFIFIIFMILFFLFIIFSLSYLILWFILWFIYRFLFKSKKKVSKSLVFLTFLGCIGLIMFYYTPLSYYLEPSYWKFRKMCKMQYNFVFKGIGSEEAIVAYVDNYKIQGSWHSGRYYLSIPDISRGELIWNDFYINCTDFYNEWDKDWYGKVQRGEIYGK